MPISNKQYTYSRILYSACNMHVTFQIRMRIVATPIRNTSQSFMDAVLGQQHHAEAACALALDARLLQRCQNAHLTPSCPYQPTTLTHNSTTTATLTNQPRKREQDATHLDQQHHAEATCALALAVSLLQKHLDATKKHMPASTTATYHAHTQFNNHSNPTQPRALLQWSLAPAS